MNINLANKTIFRIPFKEIFFFISLYCLLYGPKFSLIDVTVFSAFFWFLVSLKYIFQETKIDKTIFSLLLSLSVLMSYTAIIIIINNQSSIYLLINFSKIFLYLLAIFGICKSYSKHYRENAVEKILIHIFYSTYIVALTVLALALSIPLRKFLYSKIDIFLVKGANVYGFEGMWRISDLSMGGTTISLVFVICIAIGITFLLKEDERFNSKITILTGIVLMWVSTLLTARTGFILVTPFLVPFLIFYFFKRMDLSLKILFNILLIMILTVALANFITPISNLIDTLSTSLQSIIEHILPWALEYLYSYNERGEFYTASGSVLFKQFRFSPNFTDLIFGSGQLKDGMGVMDSLFMLIINTSGLIGFFIFISVLLTLFIPLLRRDARPYRFLIASTFLIFIIANLKEALFGDARGAIILILIILIAIPKKMFYKKNKDLLINGIKSS